MKPIFWRKLDTLLRHHLPLMDSLSILKKESTEPAEKKFVDQLCGKLRAGSAFSDAACQQNVALRGILKAGENAGDLGGAVSRIATRLESQEKLRAQVIAATIYPCLILLLCLGLCAILSGVVLPRFEKLFVSMGVSGELPPLTRFVMGFGGWLRRDGLWLVIGVAVIGVAARFYFSPKRWQTFLWRLPIVGELWKTIQREDFFNTLAILLKSGAPLDEALRIVAEALADSPLAVTTAIAAQRVREGDTLSSVLRAGGLFEESQWQLIALSEQTGALGESAERLAEMLREKLQTQLKTTMTLLEPVLILSMAGVVALMVVALFLPLGPLVAKLAEGGA